MESNRKRKGFVKGKLMPFYRAGKPASSTVQYSSNIKQVKPNQSSPSTASVGFLQVQQDYLIAQPKQIYDNFYAVTAADDNVDVDTKAATYISSVRERFNLDRINSEPIKCQDML